ncbi:DUF3025 domain-containing protein [Rhodanobacter lindaniclasticus]
MGPKVRSRAQYALTHFDEAGVIVWLRDEALLTLWDAHDWHGLFWRHRHAWLDGTIRVVCSATPCSNWRWIRRGCRSARRWRFISMKAGHAVGTRALRAAIAHGHLLRDPLELRPLPLSGIPGWHPDNVDEAFASVPPATSRGGRGEATRRSMR